MSLKLANTLKALSKERSGHLVFLGLIEERYGNSHLGATQSSDCEIAISVVRLSQPQSEQDIYPIIHVVSQKIEHRYRYALDLVGQIKMSELMSIGPLSYLIKKY